MGSADSLLLRVVIMGSADPLLLRVVIMGVS